MLLIAQNAIATGATSSPACEKAGSSLVPDVASSSGLARGMSTLVRLRADRRAEALTIPFEPSGLYRIRVAPALSLMQAGVAARRRLTLRCRVVSPLVDQSRPCCVPGLGDLECSAWLGKGVQERQAGEGILQ
ncbi:hypothetical protein AB0M19_36290 [Streptomyces sp. NPDC051920]|uniref:hypothetical protein n=1 Tax=Streptomyces sp. NPDC051920 TaxID=3155523 RepID=UPI003435ACA8